MTLKRELSWMEAVALSVAIMAPSAAMALNGALGASIAGTAVPLTYVIAMVTVSMVAFSFIEFSKYFAHSGSSYIFAGYTLGPKVGFLAGWLLFGTYLTFTGATLGVAGNFAQSFFQLLGWKAAPWLPFTIVATAITWLFAVLDIRLSTRTALLMEGISIVLVAIVVAVILGTGGAAHQLTGTPFTVGSAGFSAVGLATVFGFLSFAGFEGAATLGEESTNPKRDIPRAIFAAVGVIGTFYVIVTYAQSIGFGLSAAGVKAFAGSTAPMGQLASTYVGPWMGALIDFGATISGIACALGSVTAASRMLFSLGRDGLSDKVTKLHSKYGSPYVATNIIMAVNLVVILAWSPTANGADLFGYLGTMGVLALLVVYMLTNISAFFLFRKLGTWTGVKLVVPWLAVVALLYSLYNNVWPIPPAPYNYFPYITAIWGIVGFGLVASSARIREGVAREVGQLTPTTDMHEVPSTVEVQG